MVNDCKNKAKVELRELERKLKICKRQCHECLFLCLLSNNHDDKIQRHACKDDTHICKGFINFVVCIKIKQKTKQKKNKKNNVIIAMTKMSLKKMLCIVAIHQGI